MKTIIFLLNAFIIGFLVLTLTNCKKDIPFNDKPREFRRAPDAIETLIKNPNNFEDEELNMFLYNYAKAIQKVANYPDLLNTILVESKKSEENIVQINKLYELDDNIENIIYSYFLNNNISFAKEDSSYIPLIYVINSITCDINKPPIIAIGTDFYSLDSTLEDYIPAWTIDDEDTLDIVINEEEAIGTNNPVLIITNYFMQNKRAFNIDNNASNSLNNTREGLMKNSTNTSKRYFISQYQIDFRYETSNHSEYEIKYAVAESGGSFFEQVPFRIANVHKNNIATWQDCWKEFYNNRYNSSGQLISNTFQTNKNYLISGVTYEYDWYASKKIIIVSPCTFECRMKFPNEFYQIIANAQLTFNNGSNIDIPGKGYVRIQRND